MTDDDHGATAIGLERTGEADPLLVASLGELLHDDAEPPHHLALPASGDEIVGALAALVPIAWSRGRVSV